MDIKQKLRPVNPEGNSPILTIDFHPLFKSEYFKPDWG